MKLIKHGYKIWVRADMDGYISKFEVYEGKVKDINQTPSEEYETSHFGLGEQAV